MALPQVLTDRAEGIFWYSIPIAYQMSNTIAHHLLCGTLLVPIFCILEQKATT